MTEKEWQMCEARINHVYENCFRRIEDQIDLEKSQIGLDKMREAIAKLPEKDALLATAITSAITISLIELMTSPDEMPDNDEFAVRCELLIGLGIPQDILNEFIESATIGAYIIGEVESTQSLESAIIHEFED